MESTKEGVRGRGLEPGDGFNGPGHGHIIDSGVEGVAVVCKKIEELLNFHFS